MPFLIPHIKPRIEPWHFFSGIMFSLSPVHTIKILLLLLGIEKILIIIHHLNQGEIFILLCMLHVKNTYIYDQRHLSQIPSC